MPFQITWRRQASHSAAVKLKLSDEELFEVLGFALHPAEFNALPLIKPPTVTVPYHEAGP